MPKDKRYHPPQEETTDPYTGEKKPVPRDAENMSEEIPVDPGDRNGRHYLLEEETSMDAAAADGNADDAARQAASYSDDEDIKADFIERQSLGAAGRKILEEELEEHHSQSPKLSAGDLDAGWQHANQDGEEAVGGSTPTPDQDQVDELGRAVGLTYSDEEPLQGEEKLLKRDRNRWELDPASADDLDQEDEETLEGGDEEGSQ
jgi:hypothetical protein